MNNDAITEIVQCQGSFRFDISGLSSAMQNRLRSGRYEVQSVDRIKSLCPPDVPFVNLGGGLGVVDVIHNSRMLNPQMHVSVEGNPENCKRNERNRRINGAHYRIINKAVAYSKELAFFVPDGQRELIMAGSVDDRFLKAGFSGRKVVVPGISLEEVVREGGFAHFALCVDIEGAEYDLLANELDFIVQQCDWMLMEWHYTDNKNDPERSKAFEFKRVLKSKMEFDPQNSSSRMSVFNRKR